MRVLKKLLYLLTILLILVSCNLEQDIELRLPEHESQLVVECYLTPGNFYSLLLTESSGYFDSPKLPIVRNATVTITHAGITDTLKFNRNFNEEESNGQFYNYLSSSVVPEDYESEFLLEIIDQSGRKVNAKTRILPPVNWDSVKYSYNKDSLAYILGTFTDDSDFDNYYRFVVHKDSMTNIVQEFTLDDKLNDESRISLGTTYTFEKGSTGYVTLYHLEKAYFEYLETIRAAIQANYNPFSQPAIVKSNVVGGIGIFTGLTFSRKELVMD